MKLMIIDDNKQLLEGLNKNIDWTIYGITEIMTASDGEKAVEIFRNFLPDIVISDVLMPYMTGLEFLEIAKGIKPEIKVIMVSGHAEFEYAIRAMRYGVSAYELKPIKVQQLISDVSALVKEIRQEKKEQVVLQQHNQLHRNRLLMDILTGYIADETVIKEFFEEYYCELLQSHQVALLWLSVRDSYKGQTTEQKIYLEKIIGESLSEQQDFFLLGYEERNYYIAFGSSASILEQINKQHIAAQLFQSVSLKMQEMRISLSAGCGRFHPLVKISKGYEESSYVLKLKEMERESSFSIFQETTKEEIVRLRNQQLKMIQELFLAKEGEEDVDTEQKIRAIFGLFIEYHIFLRSLCMEITMKVAEMIEHYYAKIGEILTDIQEQNIYQKIEKAENVEECSSICIEEYRRLKQYVNENKGRTFSATVNRAREYISKNYAEPLTVGSVAEIVGKTANYLSHTFKVECGCSLSEYIHMVRIRKAKELLFNTNMMVYEVAERVGYSNYIHFSQVFKKYEGISPSQLRKI